jgi:hypothetical protein
MKTISICRKTIIFHVLLLAALTTRAQPGATSVGGGLGVLDTSGLIVQLKIQHEFKYVGFSAGIITTGPGQGPAFFNAEVFTPLTISDHDRFVLHAGYAFKMVSADNKYLNGHRWIVGINYERGIFDGVNMYMGPAVVNKRSFMFTIGTVGVFNRPRGCD